MLSRRSLVNSVLLARTWTNRAHLSISATAIPANRKNKPVPKTDGYDFDIEFSKALELVNEAVQPLTKVNEDFEVHYVPKESLTIETSRGSYRFIPERSRKLMTLVSYFSGFHNYYFDAEEKLWLSESDKHDMRGLITRDIMRHWNGMPHFH